MTTSRIHRYRRRHYGGLKTATADLIEQVGGVRAGGELCRVGKSQLANYASESDEHDASYAPIDVVLQLERSSSAPVVTAMLAAMQGHCLIPLPQPTEIDSILASVADVAKGAGDVMSAAATAIEDRVISRAEAAQLTENIDTLMTVLVALREGVNQ